jgi:hypothetical protein
VQAVHFPSNTAQIGDVVDVCIDAASQNSLSGVVAAMATA